MFTIKMENGHVDKYKFRLAVDGSKQVSGIDYTESLIPDIKYTNI